MDAITRAWHRSSVSPRGRTGTKPAAAALLTAVDGSRTRQRAPPSNSSWPELRRRLADHRLQDAGEVVGEHLKAELGAGFFELSEPRERGFDKRIDGPHPLLAEGQ